MKLLKKKGVGYHHYDRRDPPLLPVRLSKRPQVEVPEGGGALNESLSTAAFTPYLVDQADELSSSQEETHQPLQRQLGQHGGEHPVVVTVDTVTGDMEDAAYGWADSWNWGPMTRSCSWTWQR